MSAKRIGAKKILLEYFLQNIGTEIDRNKLRDITNVHSWARSIRTLRQEGWDFKLTINGYTLISAEQAFTNKKRESINRKLRYQILNRDNSICQRCGKGIVDGVKLEIDHKIPIEWGGDNSEHNLWTLCNICNAGKKHFYSDLDADVMKKVSTETSAEKRLALFFNLKPNIEISTHTLGIVAQTREWTRALRNVRKDNGLIIDYVRDKKKFPEGAYINIVK